MAASSDRFLLACVMGWPIAHSRSPLLHNYWFARYGLAGTYVPIAMRPEGLAAAFRALHPLGFAGCNLTIPLKQHAMAMSERMKSDNGPETAADLIERAVKDWPQRRRGAAN